MARHREAELALYWAGCSIAFFWDLKPLFIRMNWRWWDLHPDGASLVISVAAIWLSGVGLVLGRRNVPSRARGYVLLDDLLADFDFWTCRAMRGCELAVGGRQPCCAGYVWRKSCRATVRCFSCPARGNGPVDESTILDLWRSVEWRWVVVTLVAAGISTAALYVGRLLPLLHSPSVLWFVTLYSAMIVTIAITGIVCGLLRGRVLQRVAPSLNMWDWCTVSVGASFIAYFLTPVIPPTSLNALQLYELIQTDVHELIVSPVGWTISAATVVTTGKFAAMFAAIGAVVGIVVGVVQALVLRAAARGAGAWVLWSAIAVGTFGAMHVTVSSVWTSDGSYRAELYSLPVNVLVEFLMLRAISHLRPR